MRQQPRCRTALSGQTDSVTYSMNNAKKYNAHLPTMSICLAMAAFNSNLGGEDYTNKSANIKKLYNDIGCKNTEVNEGFKVKSSRQTIGIAIANKEISDGTPIIAIALRGTNYD